MMEESCEEALGVLRETFEDRLRRRLLIREREPNTESPVSFVLPTSVEEVEVLSEVAQRHSIPLVAQGAGTARDPDSEKRSLVVRFDLMRRMQLPADFEEPWVEAEPGTLWLELDNALHARGMSLAVYPTSAPRTTIGGWLAMDGIGVGSFEYGWLRENVVSADVVLPGGERREVLGEELHSFVGPEGRAGIIVGARLRTRRSQGDLPVGFAFEDREDLLASVAELVQADVPLWHLAFLNREMARARHLGDIHLLFGAYPGERAEQVVTGLQDVLEHHRGLILPPAELYRVWGQRFFPVAPSHPTPKTVREFVSIVDLPEVLGGAGARPEHFALQGTVARSGEVLLLTFDTHEEGWTSAWS
jgi:FAD/FMN-containing dehydrogenase